VKNKGLKKKAEVSGKMDASNSKYIDYYDDDEALRQVVLTFILCWFCLIYILIILP